MLMKTFRLLVLFLSLSATGCIHGDPDIDCPIKTEENTTVYFSLKDNANNQILSTTVDNITLFVYDSNGLLVTRSAISKSELNLFSGIRLKLNPGIYTLVAWANHTNAHSRFFTKGENSYVDQENNYLLTAVTENGIIDNGDPLYYAPKIKNTPLMVTVPMEGSVEVTAEFRNAHIKLEVTVEGYDALLTRAMDPLTIELTNITSRYSFGMGAHGDKVSYIRQAPNIDPENKIFSTLFNVPIFDRNSDIQILVTNSDGRLIIVPILLTELLGDTIVLEEILYLPIRIIFTEENGLLQAVVVVDLPEWGENEVKPNI